MTQLDLTIRRFYDLFSRYTQIYHIAKLGNCEITRLVPSKANDDGKAKKQVCITIDYTEQDANHDKQS
jgi:hypothetical protein